MVRGVNRDRGGMGNAVAGVVDVVDVIDVVDVVVDKL